MRKAAAMIGFGAFFLTMALLMRFYAYPKLALVPLKTNTQQTLTDDHADFFDAETLKQRTGKIVTKATVVSDKAASEKLSKQLDRDVVVINQWQSTDNVGGDGQTKAPPVTAMTQRVAIDRKSGAAVAWGGNELNGKPADVRGQTIKFPFNVSTSETYEYWDTTLGKAFPMTYNGTETVDGMKTYKFTQTVPRAKFATKDVPGELFGMGRGKQTADRYYSNERTAWVDPETGVMIKLQEKQKQTLEIAGKPPVNAMDTTSVMTPETVRANIDEYKSKGTQLKILRTWAPMLLGLLGLLAIALGALMSLRSHHRKGAHTHDGRSGRHDDERTVAPDERHGAHHRHDGGGISY